MATIVALLCLVHGDMIRQVFKICIDKESDVDHLRDEIKKKNPDTFNIIDAKDIILWKVDIPYDEDAVKQLVLKETDVIKNMSPVSKISHYFGNESTEEHIHVVVERPPGKSIHPFTNSLLIRLVNSPS